MSPDTPAISAILCTYNRADLLRGALQALCTQTVLPSGQVEVILVDDGSTDNTAKVVETYRRLLPLQYLHQRNSGLAAAKNLGISAASAPVVLFVDDDDVLDPQCLEQHLLSHRAYPDPEFAVLGYTGLARDVARSPLMQYVTHTSGHLFHYARLKDGDILDFRYFWGGRSSCKREFLLRHGVFNPIFRFGAEDIELGYRLTEHGLRVVYNSKAQSHMVRTLDFDDFCRRSYLQGRSNYVFSRLHPDSIILNYTGIDTVANEWPLIESRFHRLTKIGSDLHRLVMERSAAGIASDGISIRLLHHAYERSFRASRIKGSYAASQAPDRISR